MSDPIIPYTPFGEIPAWPPSPARLDRELDAQNNKLINVDWSGDPINLATDVTGLLPLSNIASNTGPYLLGATNTGSPVRVAIGSNVTLTGDTLSAATSGGAGSGDFSTNTSTSVVNEIVLFSNTGGKQGKRSTGTGVCQLSSGVLSVGAVPLSGNVSGTLPAANMPALTGDVTSTVGTVATTIANLAVTNAKLAGGITASNLVGTDIATVGTVTSGQWAATPVAVAYGGTGSTSVAGARAALGIETSTSVGDTDYSVLTTDSAVVLNATLTGVRTWTLPQASTVNNGAVVKITDSVAGISSSNYIQVSPFAGDTINGSTNSYVLNRSYGVVSFVKSGSTKWNVFSTPAIVKKSFFSNQTYTTPVGVKTLLVEAVGGGGGGGGAAVASSNLSLGSGGGGGTYSAAYISTPLSSYLITIGTGGTGVSGATGNAGGTTSFGAAVTAVGGNPGIVLAAGTAAATVLGGASTFGGAGDYNIDGGCGGFGLRLNGTDGISGEGGSSITSPRVVRGRNTTGNGGNGDSFSSPGAGGGGAFTTGAAQAGGSGSSGVVFITEYY